MVVEIELN